VWYVRTDEDGDETDYGPFTEEADAHGWAEVFCDRFTLVKK
jgi:hypothetical protein